jgi:hypothetical protein
MINEDVQIKLGEKKCTNTSFNFLLTMNLEQSL